MNWYRLELGTKVYECFERVTKCKEDDCRKVPTAPRGFSSCTSWMQGVRAEVGPGPGPGVPGVAEQMGAGVPFSRVPECVWYFPAD